MSDIQPPLKKQKIGINGVLPDLSQWNNNIGSTNEGVLMPNLIWKQYYSQKIISNDCSPPKSLIIPPKFAEDRSSKKSPGDQLKYPVIDVAKNFNHQFNAGENCAASLNISNPPNHLPPKRLKIHQVSCNGDGPQKRISPYLVNRNSSISNHVASCNSDLNHLGDSFNETEAAVNSVLSSNNSERTLLLDNGFNDAVLTNDSYIRNLNNTLLKSSIENSFSPDDSELTSYQEVPLSKLFPCSTTEKNINNKSSINDELALNNDNSPLNANNFNLVNDNDKLNSSDENFISSQTFSVGDVDGNNLLNKSVNPTKISPPLNKSAVLYPTEDDVMSVNISKTCVNPNLVDVVYKISKLFEDFEFRIKVDEAAKFDLTNNDVSLSKYDVLSRKLVLLLHAFSCLTSCLFPNCTIIKKLWRHMLACCDKSCTAPMCKSSCQILTHFSDCSTDSCAVCTRLRTSKLNGRCKSNIKQSSPLSQGNNVWTPSYLTRSSNNITKLNINENKSLIVENLIINPNMKPIKEKIWSREDLEHMMGPLLDLLFRCKKEKSTDCDSALLPLLCVHG